MIQDDRQHVCCFRSEIRNSDSYEFHLTRRDEGWWKMNLVTFLYVFTVTMVCVVTDLRYQKIKNSCVLMLLTGWMVQMAVLGGWKRFFDAVLGMLILFILFLVMYMLRMTGAGDVKLAAVLGLYTGFCGIERFFIGLCLCGACMAVGQMIRYRSFKKRFGYFYQYMRQIFLTGCLAPYEMPANREEVIAMALPLLCGFVWACIG